MPGFIKTPAQEKKWNAIKEAVAKQRKKSVKDFTDDDWKIVNAAFHKSEGDPLKELKAANSTSVPNPMKTAIPAIKTPKIKRLPDAFSKPSEFFKSDQIFQSKHPSIQKLKDFLVKTKRRSNLS